MLDDGTSKEIWLFLEEWLVVGSPSEGALNVSVS
jgi:hypothetical protein